MAGSSVVDAVTALDGECVFEADGVCVREPDADTVRELDDVPVPLFDGVPVCEDEGVVVRLDEGVQDGVPVIVAVLVDEAVMELEGEAVPDGVIVAESRKLPARCSRGPSVGAMPPQQPSPHRTRCCHESSNPSGDAPSPTAPSPRRPSAPAAIANAVPRRSIDAAAAPESVPYCDGPPQEQAKAVAYSAGGKQLPRGGLPT